MTFKSDKIESVDLLQDDDWTQTCVLHYVFTNKFGPTLLGASRATRAFLIYNKDADGCGSSPYYCVVAVEDMEQLSKTVDHEPEPIKSTVQRWYDDVPMAEPMAWIANNIV